MGNTSPGYPGVLLLVFCSYVLFVLYNHYFIGWFEKRDIINLRNKIRKNTSPYETKNAVDPAKRGFKRTIIELAMLDFRPGLERALPAHRAG